MSNQVCWDKNEVEITLHDEVTFHRHSKTKRDRESGPLVEVKGTVVGFVPPGSKEYPDQWRVAVLTADGDYPEDDQIVGCVATDVVVV